ncbi:coproporphyrinogen dehydrogenase [Ureaplasma urealyticum serovar 2 str. ATCC 27814]|uniref:coproporphyrinogen III oxidase family protein n=1 Tax=Ureaplasma urealyticum TaxID=2130 RepID=UPI0001794107|nr:coproporphyrinogen III oxidase family protein [Ureaplasma urealyticum]EEH02008.1 coproporphyrinogen dehydrogenase [Ureaplasma urealyticum serovar 2 str. ATCC 27814]UNT66473.1 coproporphyrinogen III oxidase family protein [Ureaplasma urealyticum]
MIFSQNTKHLYIHIPFCNHICTYSDFKRILKTVQSKDIFKDFLKDVQMRIKNFKTKQFETIYLGGGVPNCLSNCELKQLLQTIFPYVSNNCEYTIECNPELINQTQINLFKKYKINRISLNAQSLNNNILKKMNYIHTNQDIKNAIDLFYKNKIFNISCDFLYCLTILTLKDLDDIFDFIVQNKINHVSFYGLEIKDESILKKLNISINEDQDAEQMSYVNNKFASLNFKHYEVSNWVSDLKYVAKHNLAYWQTKDWAAIGWGAHGFENNIEYFFDAPVQKPVLIKKMLTKYDIYQQILMMGLRLKEGLNLNEKINNDAYLYFKDKLKYISINKKNHLVVDDLNLLNSSILDIF